LGSKNVYSHLASGAMKRPGTNSEVPSPYTGASFRRAAWTAERTIRRLPAVFQASHFRPFSRRPGSLPCSGKRPNIPGRINERNERCRKRRRRSRSSRLPENSVF